MKHIDFQSTEDELSFYRTIVDNAPIFLSINQFDNPNDPETNHNAWMNRYGEEFIGYNHREIEELGLRFFLETMHPDDLDIISNAILKFGEHDHKVFGGLVRLKPKNSDDYFWCIGSVIVLEMKDGKPWRYLVTAQNIDHMKDTQNQIIALTRENLRLRNAIKIKTLTRREVQVVQLITGSKTDREIAAGLNISIKTAKTHRHNILSKLGLKNAASVVRFALENGLYHENPS